MTFAISSTAADYSSSLESGWVRYGPENGYEFPYPRLLRINLVFEVFEKTFFLHIFYEG